MRECLLDEAGNSKERLDQIEQASTHARWGKGPEIGSAGLPTEPSWPGRTQPEMVGRLGAITGRQ